MIFKKACERENSDLCEEVIEDYIRKQTSVEVIKCFQHNMNRRAEPS